jgi:tetratricopeptide (TPR) repeat protein
MKQLRRPVGKGISGLLPLLLLIVMMRPASHARVPKFPPSFYLQKTRADQGAFLTKIIPDSIAAGASATMPGWCHLALLLVRGTPADTLRPRLYELLGDAYSESHPDSGAIWYSRARAAYRAPPLFKQIYLLQSLVYCYMAIPQKDSMLLYADETERLLASLPDTAHRKLMGMNTVAQARTTANDYERGIRAYRFVIRNSLLVKDSATLVNAFVNTGNAYNESGNVQLAIYYTQQALPYLRGNPYASMVTYCNLADYLALTGSLDSAKAYLTIAEKYAAPLGTEAARFIDVHRATILVNEHRYDAAEPLLARVLSFFQSQPPGVDLMNVLLLYASVDTGQKNYIRAEAHLRTMYDLNRKMGFHAFMAENLRLLATVNEHLGDYKEAYRFQKELTGINDSLRTDKSERAFAELQTQYQTYKKEEQINLLKKESRIKDLEIAAARRNKTLLIGSIIALLAASGTIIYIRQLRSRAAMQRINGELEMKALRSQMNPHFIFNSLNSIQKYIWENKQEDASEYLTKFARLIRLVLENSQHASVSLNEDLDALRLYIEMEHRRTNGKFDYSISVSPDVSGEDVSVPPLLLQPYVENAIWHGLSQKEGRGKLLVSIDKVGAALRCVVDDDGIGRKSAGRIRAIAAHKKSSIAMNISSQRIAWLQKDAGRPATVEITDKYCNGAASGTSVQITIPLTTIHA